jgi:hypothetical protein
MLAAGQVFFNLFSDDEILGVGPCIPEFPNVRCVRHMPNFLGGVL